MAIGQNGWSTTGNAVGVVPSYSQQKLFTSTTVNVQVPINVKRIEALLVGGGGGGGGMNVTSSASGGGGGGGGGAIGVFDIPLVPILNLTIGAGGAGGTTSPTVGSTGGLTSISGTSGIYATAFGGGGGGTISGNYS